jgi:hypothetical protein
VKQEDIDLDVNLERGMHKLAEKALKGKTGSRGGRARKSRREAFNLPPYEKVMEAKRVLQEICFDIDPNDPDVCRGSDPYLIKLDYALDVWIHNRYRQIPKSIRGNGEKPSIENRERCDCGNAGSCPKWHPEVYANLDRIKPSVKQRRFDAAYKVTEQRISVALDVALDAANWGTDKARRKRIRKQVKKGSNERIIKAHLDLTVPMTRTRIPKPKEIDLTDEEKKQEQTALALVRQVKKEEKARRGRGREKTEKGNLIDQAVRLRAKGKRWPMVFARCIRGWPNTDERVKKEKALRSAVSKEMKKQREGIY